MIEIPLWQLSILILISLLSILDRLLIPSIRWYFRRKIKRLVKSLNDHLSIEIQPFKLTKKQSLIDQLLCDSQVLAEAQRWAAKEEVPVQEAMIKVETYAKEIVPSFNAFFYFRIGYWIARNISQTLYRVRLGFMDKKGISKISSNSSVIFVINHRSNLDYVLVSFLVASQTAISYAVGEWARIWPLQSLIKFMGGYFVRRKSGNPLYRKVLERYVQMSTAAGVTQAVFLEGHLTTDGRLNPPKLGLLDYLLRNYDPTQSRDILFVPVGLNYDRTLEDRTLLLTPEEKQKSKGTMGTIKKTIAFFASNLSLQIRGKWHRYGYAYLNFGTPLSIKEYMEQEQVTFSNLEKEARFLETERLANELMNRIGKCVPVLPVALISKVFLEQQEQWLTELELKVKVMALFDTLKQQGAPVYVPRKDLDYAISVGLRMLSLRHFIKEEKGLYLMNNEEDRILHYYANSLEHHIESVHVA